MFIALSLVSIVLAFLFYQAPTPDAVGGLATGDNLKSIGALALFLGIPVKGVVDIIKGATGASGGKLPVIGVIAGSILAVLVQIGSGIHLTMQVIVLCFFAGLTAQLAAMASTGLQTKMEKSRDDKQDGG